MDGQRLRARMVLCNEKERVDQYESIEIGSG